MAFTTSNPNQLAQLALVASDMSYKGTGAEIGEALAPYFDPVVIGPEYDVAGNNFVVLRPFQDDSTGFKAIVFQNDATKDLIVSFAGTDGPNSKDWWSNVNHLGWNQWNNNRTQVLAAILPLVDEGYRFHFTGQSLGGALAQYATHDFLSTVLSQAERGRVTLTTFNALGGRDGLQQNASNFDPAVFEGISQGRHYVVLNDLASRLGGAFVGGDTYQLRFRDPSRIGPDGLPFALGIVDSHQIESGLYANLNDGQSYFSFGVRTQVPFLVIPDLQKLAANFGNVFRRQGVNSVAASIDLIAAILFAGVTAPNSQIRQLVQAVADHSARSGSIGNAGYSMLTRVDWGATIKLWTVFSALVSPLRFVNTFVGSVILRFMASAFDSTVSDAQEALQNEFGSTTAVSVGNAASKEDAQAQYDVLMTRLDPSRSSRLNDSNINIEGLAQQLTSGPNWRQNVLGYAEQASGKQRSELAALLIDIANTLQSSANASTSTAYKSEMTTFLAGQIDGWSKRIANGSPELLAKFAGFDSGAFATASLGEYQAIVNAFRVAMNDQANVSVRTQLADAVRTIEKSGEALGTSSGAGSNPFDVVGFDPHGGQVASTVGEGRGRILTLSLPFETGTGGQKIKVTLAGTNVDELRLFDGEEVIGQNGVFIVTVPEGARQIALTFLEEGDIDADSTITVKAQLVDTAGVATHVEQLEATLTLTARVEQAPEVTVTGGDGIDVFIQADNAYSGKRAALNGGAGRDLIGGSGLEDQIDGGDGDDIVIGAGGPDAIQGGIGDDFIALSVSGAASIDAGAGEDIVDARRVIDFQLREADLSLPAFESGTYGAVWKDVLANLRVTGQGDIRGERVGNAPDGSPYVVSFSPASFSGVSQGIGLRQNGSLGVVAGGGASFSLAVRADGAGWDVTYTAGAETKVFALVAGRFAGPENDAGVSIDGGAGRDLLVGSLGADLVRGGGDDDQIAGHEGDDVLTGEAGIDTIFGGAGEDFVDGGIGNDILIGEGGDDALAGADGDDHLEGDASDTPLAEQGNDHLRGGAGADTLLGQGGNDELIGDAGADQLIGGEGNDELVGGADADSLFGGAGADTLSGGTENDTLSGEAGTDVLRGGAGADQLFGGTEDDLLEGDAGADTLQGGTGNDLLFGGADNDTFFGEAGDDQIAGEAGNDSINGGTGADLLYGGAGADTYHYARGDGADRIFDTPGEGNIIRFATNLDLNPVSFELGSLVIRVATVSGGPSGDEIRLDGFDPNDPLSSSPIDFFEVWNGSTFNKVTLSSVLAQKGLKITGTEEGDQLQGTILRDLLFGAGGDDSIDALEGNDNVDGGAGNDVLIGGAGTDTLDGGLGADLLIGGTGNDTYLVDDSADEVIEFSGEGLDTVRASADFSLAALSDIENLRLEGTVVVGTGNEVANTITGNFVANVLSGGAGNDALLGGQGDDRLAGGTGNDGLAGGLGDDTYVFAPDGGIDNIAEVDVAFDGFFGSGTDTMEVEGQPADVLITRTLSNARLSFPATGASVNITQNYFRHQQGQFVYRMEQIRLADGIVRPFDDFVTPVAATPFADTLFGGSAANQISGLNGADALYGMGGDDMLEGGTGSDILSGGDGNDTYLWGRGAGHDTIDDFDGDRFHIDSVFDNPRFFYTGYEYGFSHSANEVETIQVDAGLAPADIHVSRSGASYVLTIRDSCETLTLGSWGSDATLRPEFHKATRGLRIVFADGTVWDRSQLDDLITPTPPTEETDTIQGTPRNDTLLGLGGNDSLFGLAGDDILDGGAGNDLLDAGSGSDTYLFGRGSGADTVTAGDNSAGSIDRILFAPDVSPADVVVRQSQKVFGGLMLSIAGSGDVIEVRSHFIKASDLVQFADGTSWDKQALLVQSVTGTEGPDTLLSYGAGAVLDGRGGDDSLFGSGGDTLLGGAGNDFIRGSSTDQIDGGPGNDVIELQSGSTLSNTIAFGIGSGQDAVNFSNQDIIVLGAGITTADVRVVELNRDLRLELPASGDAITINNWRSILFFSGVPSPSYFNALKEVRFADGTVWNQVALQSRAVSGAVGTPGFDEIFGTNNPDVLEGFGGNDSLAGFAGVDVYRFDRGYGVDTIFDSFDFLLNLSNTIRLGAGLAPSSTYVVTEGSNTALEFGAGDKLIVRNGIDAFSAPVNRVEFTDGTVWTGAMVTSMARTALSGGTSAANTLSGSNNSEYIDAMEGNDTINGNGGGDVLIGGSGNDSLFGGAGNDIYLFESGFGIDTIGDPGGAVETDTVRFAQGIAPADIGVTRDASGTLYLVRSPTDRILFAPADVEQVEFADGTAWDAAQLQAMPGVLPGTAGDDLLFGTPGNDTISGLGGNDLMRGGAGDDLIDPGAGNDTSVEGGDGNDTFVLARGNADDVIVQLDPGALYTDTLSVQALVSETRATRDETQLYVAITGGDARARLDGWFAASATDANRIDQVRFADGTTWDRAQLLANLTFTEPTAGNDRIFGLDGGETISALAGNDTVLGRGGDDTLDGGAGNDVLEGGDGANVYLFDAGGGADRVIALNDGSIDTLRLGAGLAPAGVRLIVPFATSDLVLQAIGTTDRVTIQAGYADAQAGWQTMQIAFADGTRWTADSLAGRADLQDAPVLAAPLPDRSVAQDQLIEFQVPSGTFTDADAGDTLTLSAQQASGAPLPGWLSFDAVSGTFRGTPTLFDVLTYNLRVTATDSSALAASDTFLLTVINVNDAPRLNVPLPDRLQTAGTSVSFSFQSFAFADPEGNPITYSALRADGSPLPSWLTFNPANRTFNAKTVVEDVGVYQIRVVATDSLGAASSDVFQITLSPVAPVVTPDGNHSPVLMQQIPDQTASVGAAFLLTIPEGTFVDQDVEDEHGDFCGDVLAYQATLADGSALPAWLQFDAATQTFSGTPGATDAGELSVRVLAYDTNGASARDTFVLKVQATATNRPPVAAPIADQSALEDAAFEFVVPAGAFIDPDAGDTLTLSAQLADGSALPAWLQFDAASARFSGTPGNADVGELSVRLTATDSALESAASDFRLAVVNVNDAPTVAAPMADQTVPVNSSFSFTVPAGTFVDIDAGDTLALSAALPSWISFDPATATFSGLATEAEEGSYAVVLTATDGSGATATDEIMLEVMCTEGVVRMGTSGPDTLQGTNCDDVLDGSAGIDTLIGKRGDDLYFVDATLVRDPQGNEGLGNGEDPPPPGHDENQNDGAGTGTGTGGPNWHAVTDTVIEAAGGGYDTVIATASFALPDHVEDLRLAGPAAIDGTGNALDNAIWGNDAANRLAGGAGNDALRGGGGGDTYAIDANEGADLIDESAPDGGGQDRIEFGSGIAAESVAVERSGDDLVLSGWSAGSVTVADWFSSAGARVEHVRFADGTVWNEQHIQRMFESSSGSAAAVAGGDTSFGGGGVNLPEAASRTAAAVDQMEPENGADPKDDRSDFEKRAQSLLWEPLPDYRFDFSAIVRAADESADTSGLHSTAGIADAWERIRRAQQSAAQVDEDARFGAFIGNELHGGMLAFGGQTSVGSFVHGNGLGLNERGAANLQTLEGLQEGLKRLW